MSSRLTINEIREHLGQPGHTFMVGGRVVRSVLQNGIVVEEEDGSLTELTGNVFTGIHFTVTLLNQS